MELLISIFCGLQHYQIINAGNGEEALKLTWQHNPDIILLDISIPILNGCEVCRIIKSNKSFCHIKVVMLSGISHDIAINEAVKAGADGFFVKPFNSMELLETVEGILAKL